MMRSLSQLWWRRYIRRNTLPFAELDHFRGLAPEQQRQALARRLQQQLQYFGTREDALPEWREAARISDLNEVWRIWPSLPIITKEMLRLQFPPKEMQPRFGLEGRADATGGSTGEPTRFFHDRPMMLACTGAEIYSRIRMGWSPGMPTAFVWGAERDIGKTVPLRQQLHSAAANEFPVAAYELTPKTVERVVSLVRQHRPMALYGFTSMLDYVARGVLDSAGSVQGVQAAWNGGEMLFPEQRERFQKAFGIPIRNRYGGREVSTIAAEFEAGGPLVILRPWLFLELVDEQGRPAVPGQPGRILCTSTICRGTPFLRYEIGDWGSAAAGHRSEAGIFALAQLEGRSSGLMSLADGRQINALFWNHLFKGYPEVVQFQIVIQRDGGLNILLQGVKMSPERAAEVHTILSNFLQATPFTITWVDKIPRTAQGKLVQVVRA